MESTEVQAKLKALDPLTSVGPPAEVRIINTTDLHLTLIAAHSYLHKTLVQIIANHRVLLGEVSACTADTRGFLVEINIVKV